MVLFDFRLLSYYPTLIPNACHILLLGPQQQQEIDEFGHFDHYQRVDRGWLTTQTVIQLKLFNNPIQMWKSKLQGVKVRCFTFCDTLSESPGFNISEFSLSTVIYKSYSSELDT